MKLVTVIFFLCLILFTGMIGCAKIDPEKTSLINEVTSTIPIAGTAGTSPEKTEILLNTTQTPAVVSSKPLIVKTLEATTLPPIFLTTPTVEIPTQTPEPTLEEKDIPVALIQIFEPGNLSQLSSPIRVQASLLPGAGNLVSLQLFGEDERIMSDQLLKMVESETGWVNPLEEIKFEIPTAGESALLVLSTRDEFGRRIAQSASQILLMQIGKSDIEKNTFLKTPFLVQSPKENDVVTGGVLYVTGYAHPFNSNPIIIELVTESGGVLESKVVKLPRNSANSNYIPFITDIPYQVDISTSVRLTIRQRSELLPNIDIALSSQLLMLEP